MDKVKISRPEAYSKFIHGDMSVMNDEVSRLFSQAKKYEKEQSMQFFYIKENDLVLLEIYWDNERVYELTFG